MTASAKTLLPGLIASVLLSGCWPFTGAPEQQPVDPPAAQADADASSAPGVARGVKRIDEDPAPVVADPEPQPVAQDPTPSEVVPGTYADFSAEVIGNGKTSVLFFHASWCPICKIADEKITGWYQTEGFPLTTYKVDYDSHLDLRQRYGVSYQHTFVRIDGQGNAIRTLTVPSDSELQAFLRG